MEAKKSRLTIKIKLLLMVGIPLLGVTGFAFNEILNQNRLSGEIDRVKALVQFGVLAGDLVHEMQKERGLSSGYLGSKGTLFGEALDKQRQETDRRYGVLKTAWAGFKPELGSPLFLETAARGFSALEELNQKRQAIEGLKIPLPEVLGYYSNTIGLFLRAIETSIQITPDPEIVRRLSAYTALLQAKERAGIIRAVMNNTFAQGKFAPGMYRRYLDLLSKHEAYLGVFESQANEPNLTFYRQTVAGPVVEKVGGMQAKAVFEQEKTLIFATGAVLFSQWADSYSAMEKEQALAGLAQLIQSLKSEDLGAGDQETHRGLTQKLGQLENSLKGGESPRSGAFQGLVEQNRRAIDQGFAQLSKTNFQVDSGDWFNQMTAKIDLFKQVENHLTADLLAQAEAMQSAILLVYLLSSLVVLLTLSVGMVQGQQIIGLLEKLITDLSHASTEVASASDEIAKSANALAAGATEQAASLEETSASMEMMTQQSEDNALAAENTVGGMEKISQIVEHALTSSRQASALAKQASQSAESGVEAMGKIVQAVEAINQGSEKIRDIVGVITEITQQTKMLATNAAIEAARAGEQGKGFAVVANEVAALAENSKAAAKVISTLIRENSANSAKGSELATQGQAVLQEILGQSQKVVGFMEEIALQADQEAKGITEMKSQVLQISSASNAQSRGAKEINQALGQMGEVTQGNAATAEQAAAAVEQLSAQAKMLMDMVTEVSAQVGGHRRAGLSHLSN